MDIKSFIFLSTLSLRRATREPTAFRTPHHRFLSTLSLRRATDTSKDVIKTTSNFYPRSPCGERPTKHTNLTSQISISIHALLAESDSGMNITSNFKHTFLSTLSLRRATLWAWMGDLSYDYFYPRSPCGERRRRSVKLFRQNYISIHALLAESDAFSIFLPIREALFLSTLSLRRATL